MAKRRAAEAHRTKKVRGPRGKTGRAGPRGAAGPSGPIGPPGPAGANFSVEIALITAQMADLIQQLHTQLVRIAQIQAQLDRLANARASEPHNRRDRSTD